MKDFETKNLKTKDELINFFEEQANTDKWLPVYTNEIHAVPLEENELSFLLNNPFCYKNGDVEVQGFAPEVEEDDIRSSMSTTKTSCIIPVQNKLQMYPLRYTAFSHIQDRAGIKGSAISSLKETGTKKEMPPVVRCDILNSCLELYRNMSLCLIRDGKITSLLSGDDGDYAIMPVIQLIHTLEKELQEQYNTYTFKNACTSHEITKISYGLQDADVEKRILQLLTTNGFLASNVEVEVQLTTSDVGLCAARITPIIKVDGKVLPIGKSNQVEHKGGSAKAMALFSDEARMTLAKYRENISNIERLMKIHVSSPIDCITSVTKLIGLVGYSSALKNIIERMTNEISSCTAFDIYWYMCEMLIEQEKIDKNKGKTFNLFASIKAQETISEVLFLDAEKFKTY